MFLIPDAMGLSLTAAHISRLTFVNTNQRYICEGMLMYRIRWLNHTLVKGCVKDVVYEGISDFVGFVKDDVYVIYEALSCNLT